MATEVELAPEIAGRAAISGASSIKWWQRPTALVAGLTAVAGGVPLAVALGVLAQPRWFPVSDFAQTELRVRDVTSGDPPLIGLAGRIGGLGKQGSHPGPLSFYALWPVYKLSGSHPWGLLASAVTLNVAAMAIAIGTAYRRAGRLGALVAAAAVAVLAQAYGPDKLIAPWNPFMPSLWWVVFLLAVWSLLDDDLALLPVAVVAGTFCTQTHVSYLGLIPGLGLLAIGGLGWRAWTRRPDPEARRRLVRWGVPSALLLAVLWIPPLVEQVREDPGNLSVVRYSFTHADPAPFGFGTESLSVWLAHLNVGVLAGGTRTSVTDAPTGPLWPGLVLLGLWVVAAGASWRRRAEAPALWRLHLVVAAALVLGLVSTTRVIGVYFDYLLLWAWATTILLVVATVWTWFETRPPPRNLLVGGLIAVLLASSLTLTYDSAQATAPMPIPTRISRHISPEMVDALAEDERYLFRWDADSYDLDFSAYGLVLELERAGFDVGIEERIAVPGTTHRVREPADATAAITYVAGPEIEAWRGEPRATEVASFEPRDAEQLAEYERLRDDLVDRLRDAGLDDLVPLVDDIHMQVISFSDGVTPEMHRILQRLKELGVEVAVFVAPVDVRPEGT